MLAAFRVILAGWVKPGENFYLEEVQICLIK